MQISVLDEKKIFLYLLGTPFVNGNDGIQYLRSYRGIKIESICFKLVESVLLIAYAILSILVASSADNHCYYFLNDETLFGSCRVMTTLLSSLSKLSMCSCCLQTKTSWH
jgi:hypothetical protein